MDVWLKSFWELILAEAQSRNFDLHAKVNHRHERALETSSGVLSGVKYRYVVREKSNILGIELLIYFANDFVKTKAIFALISEHQERAELTYGRKLEWSARMDYIRSWVRDYLDFSITSDTSNWELASKSAVDAMQKFHSALQPILKEVDSKAWLMSFEDMKYQFEKPSRSREISQETIVRMFAEGFETEVLHNRYERNPAAVAHAKLAHGDTCMACGFNFGFCYGDHGRGFIEVHHLYRVSEGERFTNPETDMTVLCSNCHRMIHRGSEMLTIEELRKIVEEQRRKRT